MSEEKTNSGKPLDFVLSSRHRMETLVALSKGYETASQISEHIGVYTSHISRALKELSKTSLAECVSPDKGRNRQYVLTDKGERISGRIGILIGRPSLEYKVIKTLDDLLIPYARNAMGKVMLEPGSYRSVADFVILNNELEPQMVLAVRDLRTWSPDGFRDMVFWAGRWRDVTEDLKAGIILGGKSKEGIIKEEEGLFLDENLMDVVIHEDDLECIRKEQLELEEFLEVEDYCVDWPELEKKKGRGTGRG